MTCLEVSTILYPLLWAGASSSNVLTEDDLKSLAARAAVEGWEEDYIVGALKGKKVSLDGALWDVKDVSVEVKDGEVTVTFVL